MHSSVNLTTEGLGQAATRRIFPFTKFPTGISRMQTDTTYAINLISLQLVDSIKVKSCNSGKVYP